jgi:hypothetical protein
VQADPTLTIQYSTASQSRQDYEGANLLTQSQNRNEVEAVSSQKVVTLVRIGT